MGCIFGKKMFIIPSYFKFFYYPQFFYYPTSKVGAINVPKLPAALLSFAISAAHGWGCSVMNDRAKAEPCSDCLQPAQ